MGSITSGRVTDGEIRRVSNVTKLYQQLNDRTDKLNAAYELITRLRSELAVERERRERIEERLK